MDRFMSCIDSFPRILLPREPKWINSRFTVLGSRNRLSTSSTHWPLSLLSDRNFRNADHDENERERERERESRWTTVLEGRFSPLGISIILDLSLTLEKIECGFALVHSDDKFFGNGIKAREHTHMMSVVVEGGGCPKSRWSNRGCMNFIEYISCRMRPTRRVGVQKSENIADVICVRGATLLKV